MQWEFREKIKRGELFKPKWHHYYSGQPAFILEPSAFLYDMLPEIPAHVDTIIDVGCGSGRNFIPFDGKYKLFGIDIVPNSRIQWVRGFKGLEYHQMKVEQFTKSLIENPRDLRNALVMSFGTLMYVSQQEQMRFFGACLANGCRNFIFTEYCKDNPRHPTEYFKLPTVHFEQRILNDRPDIVTYCLLEK